MAREVQVLHEERVGPHWLRIWRENGLIRSRMFIAPRTPRDWSLVVDSLLKPDAIEYEVATFRKLVALREGRGEEG